MAVLTFSHQLCGTPTPSALLKNTTICVVLKSNNRNSTTNHGPISLCLPCLEKWKIILSGSDIVVLVIKKNYYLKKRAQFGYIYMSLKGVPNICYLRMGG